MTWNINMDVPIDSSTMGHGVQIVKTRGERPYELNEDALNKILLEDDIVDCGVVVISVAGAYRGGKSFLLNFFLRYLNNMYQSQESRSSDDAEWLGNPRAPLIGFSWRGGSERDTIGIVMWSKPIKVTLPSGEQVVILLLDTQGTFDSSSTVRDCSTIFALSTLLSSVQIYNISQNIKEDDLQYLQLFAEYGIMAAGPNEQAAPFQTLKFLIRDWSYPYEYPYGEEGGKQLLQKRLEIQSEQPKELQDLRKRLGSCFDDITCFLMPHPGFAVTEPDFKGQLSNIKEDFKLSLLELVPSLLHPHKLRTKQINGQPVTVRGFIEYIKAYINEFNSDELPTPMSIAKATMEVGVLVAHEAARREYRARMCAATSPPRPRAALRHAHVAARASSLVAMRARLPTALIAKPLQELRKEINELFPYYENLNENNNNEIAEKALKVYYGEVLPSGVTREELCVSLGDLSAASSRAAAAATDALHARRVTVPDEPDDELSHFTKELENHAKNLMSINDKNNEAAIMDALRVYNEHIAGECGSRPCIPSSKLSTHLKEALTKAIKQFQSKRNRPSQTEEEDLYLTKLKQEIVNKRVHFERTNEVHNTTAIEEAKLLYKRQMEAGCPRGLCLHTDTLNEDHRRVFQEALTFFHSRRSVGLYQNTDMDDYKTSLITNLETVFRSLTLKNAELNKKAVEESHKIYKKKMETTMPYFKSNYQEILNLHENALRDAKVFFDTIRHRSSSIQRPDEYANILYRKISMSKDMFELENHQKPVLAEVVGNVVGAVAAVAGLAGLIGLRR